MNSDEQKLFSDYAAGIISDEDFRRFHELLENNQTLRSEFLEYMNTCAFLEDTASYSESLYPESALDPLLHREAPASVKRLSFPTWALAAAAAAVFAFFVWNTLDFTAGSRVTTQVIASQGATLHDSAQLLSPGESIELKTLNLQTGWVRLKLPRGVIFDVYGPAKGHFENDTRFHLASGRINVDVGPNGKGFTVVTATAEVVDLGTQFGIEVNEGFDARVAVFSGEVEVHSLDRKSSPRLLVEGEGVQVGSSGLSSRLMSIDIPDRSDSAVPSLNRSLEFAIHDNQTTADNLRYYGIINGGMREGARVYTTLSSVRWSSPAGQPFPAELTGASLIQTFNNDRNQEELEINLRVKSASTVFVMFDRRYQPPSWLQERFVKTNHTLISGPWKPVAIVHDLLPDSLGNYYVHYHVWQADLDDNEVITLGESVNSESREDLRAMYGIAVKPNTARP